LGKNNARSDQTGEQTRKGPTTNNNNNNVGQFDTHPQKKKKKTEKIHE